MTMNLPSIDFHMFAIIIVIGNVWNLFKIAIQVLVHALESPQSLNNIIEKVEFHLWYQTS
jgi:hypothetical protein